MIESLRSEWTRIYIFGGGCWRAFAWTGRSCSFCRWNSSWFVRRWTSILSFWIIIEMVGLLLSPLSTYSSLILLVGFLGAVWADPGWRVASISAVRPCCVLGCRNCFWNLFLPVLHLEDALFHWVLLSRRLLWSNWTSRVWIFIHRILRFWSEFCWVAHRTFYGFSTIFLVFICVGVAIAIIGTAGRSFGLVLRFVKTGAV